MERELYYLRAAGIASLSSGLIGKTKEPTEAFDSAYDVCLGLTLPYRYNSAKLKKTKEVSTEEIAAFKVAAAKFKAELAAKQKAAGAPTQ